MLFIEKSRLLHMTSREPLQFEEDLTPAPPRPYFGAFCDNELTRHPGATNRRLEVSAETWMSRADLEGRPFRTSKLFCASCAASTLKLPAWRLCGVTKGAPPWQTRLSALRPPWRRGH